MTKEEALARIKLLSSEIEANEEEARVMQAEIDSLYAGISSPNLKFHPPAPPLESIAIVDEHSWYPSAGAKSVLAKGRMNVTPEE